MYPPSATPEPPPRTAPLAWRDDAGPFDLVGDLHGCLDELLDLLSRLGYRVQTHGGRPNVTPPGGRRLLLLGDLASRGPKPAECLALVLRMIADGHALIVAGNQDRRLLTLLSDDAPPQPPGLLERRLLDALDAFPHYGTYNSFRAQIRNLLAALPSHLVLDQGRLVAAHAGLPQAHHGSSSPEASQLAIEGRQSGERDEFGHPIRHDWAAEYSGPALVVFGHSPVVAPFWRGQTLNLDTGCVYGGHLSALRYPELEILSVPARALYSPSRRRFPPNAQLRLAPGEPLPR